MMIRLTSAKFKLGITLRADMILFARRAPDEKITTHVVTSIAGPKGLEAFHVEESPEQVAFMVNAVLGANLTRDQPANSEIGLSSSTSIVEQ